MSNIAAFVSQIEAYRKQAEVYRKQTEIYRKQIEACRMQALKPFVKMHNQMQEYARRTGSLKNVQEFIRRLTVSTKIFFEALEKSINSDYKAFTWMINNGWPPLMHVAARAPTRFMNYCIERNMDSTNVKRLLDKEIVKFHDSDMIKGTILSSWEKSFISKKRIGILQSAGQAHLDKKYELSVPALLPQLEGIIGEYFNYSTNSIGQCEEYFIPQKRVGSIKEFTKDEIMELIFNYLTCFIFAGIDNNDSKLMEINRHKILHGVYVNYDKESVSLKLILIIDMLITYPKFVSLPNARVYHMPHCPCYKNALKNNKKKHRIIYTKMSVSSSGLVPCKRCLKLEMN